MLHGFYGDDRRLVFRIEYGDEVDREVARRLASPSAGVEDVAFAVALNDGGGNVAGLEGLGVGMDERRIADDEDALGQTDKLRVGLLDSFDDDRARGSTLNLRIGVSVDVGVVPVESWGFVQGDAKTVFEDRVAGQEAGIEGVVLMADGRDGEAMKVKVGRERRHSGVDAGSSAGVGVWQGHGRLRGQEASRRSELVFETEDELISGFEAERGSLRAIVREVAEALLPVGGGEVVEGQLGFERAVGAVDRGRLGNEAAFGWMRAGWGGCRSCCCKENDNREKTGLK